MICYNCRHVECVDYIRGSGICAILEGETVKLDEECICPKDVYDDAEAFLRANGKGHKCNGPESKMSITKEDLVSLLEGADDTTAELISLAVASNLNKEQMRLVLQKGNLGLEAGEVAVLGLKEGLTQAQVEIFYNDRYDHWEMLEICTALIAGVSDDELKEALEISEDAIKVAFEMTKQVLNFNFYNNMNQAKDILQKMKSKDFYKEVSHEAKALYEKFVGAYVSCGYINSGCIEVEQENKVSLQELVDKNVVQKRECDVDNCYELTIPYRFSLIDICKLDYVWSRIGRENYELNNGYFGELHTVIRAMIKLNAKDKEG